MPLGRCVPSTASLLVNYSPPRITRKSCRPRASDRTMVDTFQPRRLSCFRIRKRRRENRMNQEKTKTPKPSQHDMGWKAQRTFSLLPVAGEIFLLTLPFYRTALPENLSRLSESGPLLDVTAHDSLRDGSAAYAWSGRLAPAGRSARRLIPRERRRQRRAKSIAGTCPSVLRPVSTTEPRKQPKLMETKAKPKR